jgi:hypothetical protein
VVTAQTDEVAPPCVTIEEAPYRIDVFTGPAKKRLAYAVVDRWGWALLARIPSRRHADRRPGLETVDRVDFARWPTAAARAEVRRRLARRVGTT